MIPESKPRVVCLRPKADFDKALVTVPGTLDVAYAKPDAPELPKLIADTRALIIPAVGPKLPSELFVGSAIEIIQVTGAGVDRLDRGEMERLGIPVANVPGGSNEAVAEYAISMTMMLLRRLSWASAEIGQGHYGESRQALIQTLAPGLGGLTVGIIGLGTIGLAVAQTFRRFGSNIIYFDPALGDSTIADAISAKAVSLEDLLCNSDVVSLHVPLLAETQGLIDAAAISSMKPSAIMINAARGGVVDEVALVSALKEDRLGGAAVDVYSEEPPQADNPLISNAEELSGKMLLTPHIAGITRQSWAALFEQAWQNVEAVLCRGENPSHRVF